MLITQGKGEFRVARICLMAEVGKAVNKLRSKLADSGFAGSITLYAETAAVAHQSPDIVLIELSGYRLDRTEAIIRKLKRADATPVMTLVPEEMIDHPDLAEEYLRTCRAINRLRPYGKLYAD